MRKIIQTDFPRYLVVLFGPQITKQVNFAYGQCDLFIEQMDCPHCIEEHVTTRTVLPVI